MRVVVHALLLVTLVGTTACLSVSPLKVDDIGAGEPGASSEVPDVTADSVEQDMLPADPTPENPGPLDAEVPADVADEGAVGDPFNDVAAPDSTETDTVCAPQCCDKVMGDDGCGGCCGGCCPNGKCESEKGETLATCAVDCHVCGDGTCSLGESFQNCEPDCCGVCGDGKCAHYVADGTTYCNETPTSCPSDCQQTACGNGTCEAGEDTFTCPTDCLHGVCGNHVCEPSDGGPMGCPEDCAATCGNCVCEGTESAVTCPGDCGWCGDGVCSNCASLGEKGSCKADCGG